MLNASTIGGYVLEEVLAKLLADNGYNLLTDDHQDPAHLLRDKHGLLVRGRGADHQADALGDLLVPLPFSLPVRLFAEAKNRATKTGLDAVRNAVGVVSDVNQFQPPPAGMKLWRGDSTYHYRYSLFSTSGFTGPAQDFALAHQVSLIDLSGPAFAVLREAVEIFASAVQTLAIRAGLDVYPVGQMRAALRVALGTVAVDGEAADPSTRELSPMPWNQLDELAYDLASSIDGDLVLGFPPGPQVLVLRPDDARAFREWSAAMAGGIVSVGLRYAPGRPQGEWVVVPIEPAGRWLVLRFGTPPALAEWLFGSGGDRRRRLDDVKRGLLSTITIYQGGRPVILEVDSAAGRASEVASREEVLTQMQEELLDRDLAFAPEEETVGQAWGGWSVEAASTFVDALRLRDPARLAVLFHAANHRDWVSRAHIYELMGFDPKRKMTGFTKPFEGIRRMLVEDRLLAPDSPNVFVPRYPDRGGWALGLDLDPDFGNTLRTQLPWLLDIQELDR